MCAQAEGARAQGDGFSGKDQEEDAVKEMGKEESRQEQNVGVKRRKRTCFRYLRDVWNGMRRKLWGIVESKYFSQGIMIAILINTISMGIEHHNQVRSESLDMIVLLLLYYYDQYGFKQASFDPFLLSSFLSVKFRLPLSPQLRHHDVSQSV